MNDPINEYDPVGLTSVGESIAVPTTRQNETIAARNRTVITPELINLQIEWERLGCADCPEDKVSKAQAQCLDNIVELADWIELDQCHSLAQFLALTRGRIYADISGYRGPQYYAAPSCIRRSIDFIETTTFFRNASRFSIVNQFLNPFSETFCCLGDSFAGDEIVRQGWLYGRLTVVLKRCAQLKALLPPSMKRQAQVPSAKVTAR